VTLAVIWCCRVLFPVDVDTEFALQNEIFLLNLGHQMLSAMAVSEAGFMVRQTATLTVNKLTSLM
jgi:hypothetical protein